MTNPIINLLLTAEPLRVPVLSQAVRLLELPKGSRGLDLGCGVGLQSQLLARAVGPEGRVTAADINPELLAYGADLAAQAGLAERITFREADMYHLPFEDASFDWLWSADCAGYPAADWEILLRELVRVVRPGGRIFLLAWTSQQVLPGYAMLEARLNASCSSYAPFLLAMPPEQHFMRALDWFGRGGLEECKAHTLLGQVQAPLNAGQKAALVSLFEMQWVEPSDPALHPDWELSQRLCRADSPEFILNKPGYYAFFTITMFQARLRV